MIRRRLFRQLSEAQTTGMQRPLPPPPETAGRWRCVLLINNLAAHYNSQFTVSFTFFLSGIPQITFFMFIFPIN